MKKRPVKKAPAPKKSNSELFIDLLDTLGVERSIDLIVDDLFDSYKKGLIDYTELSICGQRLISQISTGIEQGLRGLQR